MANGNSSARTGRLLSCTRIVVLALLSTTFFASSGFAQVAVTGDTNTTPNLATTYTSLANAITALNGVTAISGPVVITLTGNETAPAGGYAINFTSGTPTGASTSNNITIQGSGSTITAFTPQTSGNLNDAIFKLIGADFITIQNFTMQENAANTTTASGTNNMTEWGVALLYKTTTDGASNNIIQNNTISLNRSYSNTFGIYSNVRHSSTAPTSTADITTAPGANSNNKVYGNSISNVDKGIVFVGSSTAAAMDSGNDVGGTSAGTGNTITNWGGLVSGAMSGYVSVTSSDTCIQMNDQVSDNVSFNTITSATNITTLTTTGFLGILKSQSFQPTGLTFTSNYNSNTVTLTYAPTTSQMTGIGLQGLTTLSTATFNCNNNTIINCAITGASATSAFMVGMLHSSAPGTFNINNNTIRGFTTTATTGGFIGIQQQTNGVVTALNMNSNHIGDATAGAVTLSATANSGTVTGLAVTSTGAAAGCALSINGNDFRGITHSAVGSGAHTYITWSHTASATDNINTNTFTNLNVNTTGSVTFLARAGSMAATGVENCKDNTIVTGFNKGGAGGTVTFYTANASSVNGSSMTQTGNNFSNVTLTGATIVAGWSNTEGASSANGPTKTITGNTFSTISTGAASVTGMSVNFSGASTNVSNNTISNLTNAPTVANTNLVTGISIGSSNGQGTHTYSNNTISGLSTTGLGGQLVGILGGSASIVTLNISNNTFSNLSSVSATNVMGAIGTLAGATNNITGNTISGLTLTSTGANVLDGILVQAGTTTNVSKNRICNLLRNGAATAVGVCQGLAIAAGTTVTASNNLIGDLRAPVTSQTDAVRGIAVTSTTAATTYNIYYNTVNLSASSTGTNFGTSGVFLQSSATGTTAATSLRNNIIVNTSTPSGTGLTVAHRRSGVDLANYASSSNNNDFYCGTPDATHVIYNDSVVSDQTIAAYKTRVASRDSASINEDPEFQNTTCGNADFLKYKTTSAKQIESGAANIAGITDDVINTIRAGNGGYGGTGTAPDMGAWELEGIPADLTAPTISYTAISGACSADITLIATIADSSGVPTSGTLRPRIYYKKNAGSFFSQPGTLTSGTSTNGAWSFTIVSADFGGAIATDTISYFVIAQDQAATPNIGSNPSAGLVATDVNNVTTPPTTPNTFQPNATSNIIASASATPAAICSGGTSNLAATATFPGSPILITEVLLNNGGTGTGTIPAYASSITDGVEISNISSSPISISGYTLSDYASASTTVVHPYTFPASAVIPANGVLLVHLGTGTDSVPNLFFNTGGTSDNWLSSSLVGIALKNGSTIVDAVGCGSGYTFAAGTGVTASDWSGFAPSASGLAGTVRTASVDTNAGSNWSASSATTLTLGVYNGGYSSPTCTSCIFSWSPAGDVVSPNSASTSTNALTATEVFTVTVTNPSTGCTATANTTVTVDPLTCTSITFSSTRCAGSPFTVTANKAGGGAPFHYAWSDGVGGVYPDAQVITANLAAGTYTFSVTVTDSCSGSCNMNQSISVNALPTASISPGGPVTVCPPNTSQLLTAVTNASSPTYQWKKNGVDISGATSSTLSVTTLGNYSVVVTDGVTGCVNTASAVSVAFDVGVSVTASATPSTICPSGSSQLNAVASNAVGVNYSLSSLSGQTYSTLSGGGITTINTNAGLTTGFGDGTQDDGGVLITLPFNFSYQGNTFTQMSMSCNGWVAAGNLSTISAIDSRAAANLFSTTAPNNTIAAWFKDMGANFPLGTGSMRHGLIGTDVYAFQWDKAVGSSFSDGSSILISFQINIYGPTSSAPGTIDIIYGPTVGTIAFAASEGIEDGTGGTNHYLNALTGNGTTTTTSTVWPGNGNGYRFSPSTFSYSWSPTTFLSNPNIANPMATGVTSTTVYTVTATDVGGCSNTANATVTVSDTTLPVISGCPSDIGPVNNDAGLCSAVVSWTAPTASDNCSVASFVSDHSPGDAFPVGDTLVTYTATDTSNNVKTCSFHVVVADTENPTIGPCPANIQQNTDPGQPYATVTWTPPAYGDNCPHAVLTSNHNPGDQFLCGQTSVTYTVTDGASLTASCGFTVTVTDAEFPVFTTCPQTIHADADEGVCTHVVTWSEPTATDNKGTPVIAQTEGPPSGSAFPVGSTHIKYTATDPQNNVSVCEFDVIITDTQNPTYTGCPASFSVNTDPDACSAVVTWTPPTPHDNCPGVQSASDHAPGETFPIGPTTVTYTATDASNHTVVCQFTITVEDHQNPTVNGCPGNIVTNSNTPVCSAVVSWTAPTASDNCPGSSIAQTQGQASGSTFGPGVHTIKYTATDAALNTTDCIFTVTVAPTPDVNNDGNFDLLDVAPFANVLLGLDVVPMHVLRSDVNCDGNVDGLDIAPFVHLLVP